MNDEKTILDNNNIDNERTQIFNQNVSNAAMPPIPGSIKSKNNKDRNIGIAAGVAGVAAAGATATAAYALNNTDTDIEPMIEDEDIIPEPQENVQPVAEVHQEVQEQHHHEVTPESNMTENATGMQTVAVHQSYPTNETENEIEILGVVHDEDSNSNIAALNVSGQDVFFIDVDNDLNFDYMAVDADNSGDFSDDEIVDITDQGISVASLGGFSNSDNDPGPNYAENSVPQEPQHYAYEADPILENNFDNGLGSNDLTDVSSDFEAEVGDLI